MSDSVQPHRRQPTRLLCPWDSPSNNSGVGCHFLLQCMKVKSESEVTQSCLTLSDPMDLQPTRLLRPWDFPGKSTGVGCHCLLHLLNLDNLNWSVFWFFFFQFCYEGAAESNVQGGIALSLVHMEGLWGGDIWLVTW